MGQGQKRVPNKGRWAHDNVKLLHLVIICYGHNSFIADGLNEDSFYEDILLHKDQSKEGYDILVVGAGLSGAVMANLYARLLNKNVLVVDKRNHIAGKHTVFV